MDSRYVILASALAEQGWRVAHRDRDVEWWADDIWTVESEWSPRGFTVYLTWLRDPQDEATVWAVSARAERPTDRAGGEQGLVRVKHWPREMPALVAAIAALRTASQRAQLDRAPHLP